MLVVACGTSRGARILPVNEDEFWAIVASSRADAGGEIAGQPEALRDLLVQRPVPDVVAFGRLLTQVTGRACTNDMAHAAGLLLGGVADDSFMDFRTWLACHGREIFEAALADPDSIVELPYDDDEDDFGSAEEFSYVADEVFEERTGEEPPDDDEEEPEVEADLYDQATLRARFPRLWARAEQRHPEYLREREEWVNRL